MKHLLRTSLLSAALSLSAALYADGVTPYLETASVTFSSNFTISGLTSTREAIPAGGIGVLDPERIRPVDRVSTDISTLINYSVSNGDQAFFVKHLLRASTERLAEQYRSIALDRAEALSEVSAEIEELDENLRAVLAELAVTTDAEARAALKAQKLALEQEIETKEIEAAIIAAPFDGELGAIESKLKYLKEETGDKWEITSVRNAQGSLEEATSTPFALFLTRTDRFRRGITYSFDSGLRLIPIYSTGTSTENFAPNLSKVSGNYVTHLALQFESLYAADPLSSLAPERRAIAVEGKDYNTTGEFWELTGSGYMSYSLRSTPGPIVAVYPSNIKFTGHGSRAHYPKLESDAIYAGIAPFAIKIGAVKYQNKNIFPEFTGE